MSRGLATVSDRFDTVLVPFVWVILNYLTLKVKCKVQGHIASCTCADVIGTVVCRHLTLNLTFKVTCQVKYHGCASCLGRFVCEHFGMRAYVISGRNHAPCHLTLNLSIKMTLKIKITVIFVQRPQPEDYVCMKSESFAKYVTKFVTSV